MSNSISLNKVKYPSDNLRIEDKYNLNNRGIMCSSRHCSHKSKSTKKNCKQTGKLLHLGQNYGFIQYDGLEKTTRPGLIYFYDLDCYGGVDGLEVGEVLEYEVVYNQKSGLFVGKSVGRVV